MKEQEEDGTRRSGWVTGGNGSGKESKAGQGRAGQRSEKDDKERRGWHRVVQ